MLDAIGIQPLPLVGQIVSFLILYFVFKKFMFGPILENLDKRAKKQKQALKAAEETIQIKEELAIEQKKAEQKIQQKVRSEMAKAREEAHQKKEELVQEAQQEAKKAAQKEYDIFTQKLAQKEQQVKKDLSLLVIQAARKALSEQLDQKTSREIVRNQIKKLKKLKV